MTTRAVGAFACAVALGAAALAGCGGDSAGGDPTASGADAAAIEAAIAGGPCPPDYEVVIDQHRSGSVIADAREGRFEIADREVELEPPVEWTMDPEDQALFRSRLHNLTWLDVLITAHQGGDDGALEQALELTLDWIEGNPAAEPTTDKTWSDKVVGDRAPYVAFVARAAECDGQLDEGSRATLARSLAEHAEFLLDEDNRPPNNNHGLFVDLGLLLLGNQLIEVEEAAAWREVAEQRFLETFANRMRGSEGFWLEHSAAYQLTLRRLMEKFADAAPELTEPQRLLSNMRETAAWMFRPDGELTLFGDSNPSSVPGDVRPYFEQAEGLYFLGRSGLAAVREDESYLLALATFFNVTHKQSDDLSFELFEGEPVITDTGRYHQDRDEWWQFQNSTRAHSVLTADDEEWLLESEDSKTSDGNYGSGIVARGEGSGWYAILGTNPAIERQGVNHFRLWLYRPGEALVVVDRVRTGEERTYRRYFHFAPQIAVREADAGVLRLRGEKLRGSLTTEGRVELVRGEEDPLQGWQVGEQRQAEPRTTAIFTTRGQSEDLAAAFALDGAAPLRAEVTEAGPGVTTIELRGGDNPMWTITARRDGPRIELDFDER